MRKLDDLLAAVRASDIPWVLVSNEVGCGVVPPYALGRVYRDLLGWANQRLAAEADKAYFMVAGFPLDLKALSANLLLDGGDQTRSNLLPPSQGPKGFLKPLGPFFVWGCIPQVAAVSIPCFGRPSRYGKRGYRLFRDLSIRLLYTVVAVSYRVLEGQSRYGKRGYFYAI
jgi:hypothetical protein